MNRKVVVIMTGFLMFMLLLTVMAGIGYLDQLILKGRTRTDLVILLSIADIIIFIMVLLDFIDLKKENNEKDSI